MPARSLTSVNVPSPLLWYRRQALLRKAAGTAKDGHAAAIAGRIRTADGNFVRVESYVVVDEEIQLAVAIVVDPGAAGSVTRAGMGKPRLLGHVRERAVAVVVKQDVLAPAGDEEIVEAVVIVIADRDPGGPDAAAEARARGHVAERAVAIVAIQADRRVIRRSPNAPPAGESHDIEPPVIVVVEKCHAASHRIENVVDVAFVAVDDRSVQARLRGHIDELCMERQPGWLPARGRRDASRRHAAVLLRQREA